ncbi:MAG TPA: ATP-binding cassette domain-containing protein, partial [Anaerolineales bacterium]|nr:ATP-binding cassette domain-containing protein [Anaerolineales bacterium]
MSSLKATGVGKSFPGVVALDAVSFEVRGGTIHALVGANGAGKSTLIKLLSGVYTDFTGRIEVDDRPVRFSSPA